MKGVEVLFAHVVLPFRNEQTGVYFGPRIPCFSTRRKVPEGTYPRGEGPDDWSRTEAQVVEDHYDGGIDPCLEEESGSLVSLLSLSPPRL